MTEEDAKENWCFERALIAAIKHDNSYSASSCIASACGKWVWNEESLNGLQEYRHGHCGLAK